MSGKRVFERLFGHFSAPTECPPIPMDRTELQQSYGRAPAEMRQSYGRVTAELRQRTSRATAELQQSYGRELAELQQRLSVDPV